MIFKRFIRTTGSLLDVVSKDLIYDTKLSMAPRKVLNVAEKNDAAKNIANILSRGTKTSRPGLSKYNLIYEFKYSMPPNNLPTDMIFTSVSGHLLNYDFPNDYQGWHKVDPLQLFSAQVVKSCGASKDQKFAQSAKQIKNTLEREGRKCDTLIIWTDCDREGENIGFEIIGVVKKVNPRIQVRRAKFSEITGAAINRAISYLVDPDEKVSNAVDARQILDLRIGAAFTRFQTMFLRSRFPSLNTEKSVLSYGPCQFPTLGFVVERYKQIKNFTSEPFWYLEATHKKDGIMSKFNWSRVRSFEQDILMAIYVKVMQDPVVARVTAVQSKRKTRWRPQPMDTIAMEKLASSKLHISAKQAMVLAEKLYTSGWISYPRTETTIFPKELNLQSLVQSQTAHPHWGQFAQRVLNDGINPRQGNKSDQAHPPIHPTKFTDSLTGDHARLYELIVRHFLACCHKDAVGNETSIDIEIAEEKFNTKGLIILEKNFLDVYHYERWSSKEVANYQQGDTFTPDSVMSHEGKTTPPGLLNESDLITLMDKNGIGTDATHAEHIETIQTRGYVTKMSARFRPTYLGLALYEGYDEIKPDLTRPILRANLERDLVSICEGRADYQQILQRQVDTYRQTFELTRHNQGKLEESCRRNSSLAPGGNLKEICPVPEYSSVSAHREQGGDVDDFNDDLDDL